MKTRRKYNFKKRKRTYKKRRTRRKRNKKKKGGNIPLPLIGVGAVALASLGRLAYSGYKSRKAKRQQNRQDQGERRLSSSPRQNIDSSSSQFQRPSPSAPIRRPPSAPIDIPGPEARRRRQKIELQRQNMAKKQARNEEQLKWERKTNAQEVLKKATRTKLPENPEYYKTYKPDIISKLQTINETYKKQFREFQKVLPELQKLIEKQEEYLERFKIINNNVVTLSVVLDEKLSMFNFIVENLDRIVVEKHTRGWWWCVWSKLVGLQGQKVGEEKETKINCEMMDLSNRVLPGGIRMVKGMSYPISRFYLENDDIMKYWNHYMSIIYETLEKVDYTGKGLEHNKRILDGLTNNTLKIIN